MLAMCLTEVASGLSMKSVQTKPLQHQTHHSTDCCGVPFG